MPWDNASLDFIWANDGMNYLVPAEGLSRDRTFYDDDGFTNDLTACATGSRGGSQTSVCGRHRMITERGGLRRADEVLVSATLAHRLPLDSEWALSTFAGVGIVATGPMGGAEFQDAFHRLIRWGRTLSGAQQGQLQNTYEGGVRMAPRLHVGARMQRNVSDRTSLFAGGEAAVNPGAGASAGQMDVGIAHRFTVGQGRVNLFADLALRHLRAEEERLTFSGAYPEAETFLQPSGGLSYRRGAQEIGFALLLNVEGSGSHQGALSFRKQL